MKKKHEDICQILDAIDDSITIYTAVIAIVDPKILLHLTQCKSVDVRRAIACAPASTWRVLSKLIDDPDITVRKFVCMHHKCPNEVIERFIEDNSTAVSRAAKEALIKRKVRHQKREVAKAIAKTIGRRRR